LAREAIRQGADWVIPFDADEFWWMTGGNVREALRRVGGRGVRRRGGPVARRPAYHDAPLHDLLILDATRHGAIDPGAMSLLDRLLKPGGALP
jgi:hypothetical protein